MASNGRAVDYDEGSEKHFLELESFKEEFGHCNVSFRYAVNPPLGQWCSTCTMRNSYNKIQNGLKPAAGSLSQERIDRLKEIGFKWKVVNYEYEEGFEKRCRELIAFIKDFGHCIIPVRYAANKSLGSIQ